MLGRTAPPWSLFDLPSGSAQLWVVRNRSRLGDSLRHAPDVSRPQRAVVAGPGLTPLALVGLTSTEIVDQPHPTPHAYRNNRKRKVEEMREIRPSIRSIDDNCRGGSGRG